MALQVPTLPSPISAGRKKRHNAIWVLVAAFILVPALMGIGYYTIHPTHSDFLLYYRDARTGWVFGWSHLYDVGAWDAITRQLGIHSTDPNSGSLSLRRRARPSPVVRRRRSWVS